MNPTNQEAETIKTQNVETTKEIMVPQETKPYYRKKRPIRSYHLESDIFHFKTPLNNRERKIKTYNNSDIFFLKNETQIQTKKKPVKRDLYSESNYQGKPEKKTKTYLNIQARETTQKDVKTKRFMPEKRREDKENTLAYDLSGSKPQLEKPQKRLFPNTNREKAERKGKKILTEKIKEDPGNTLAYH